MGQWRMQIIMKNPLQCLRFPLKTVTVRYLSTYRAYLSVRDFTISRLAYAANERKQTRQK